MSKEYGKPLFKDLKYCLRCCMPETQEGLTFDEMGICKTCQSAEEKMHIDWASREKKLRKILEEARKNAGNNYDCICPISGGKDSTFQLHTLVKVYNMRPLAITFSHNWFSQTGWYNLFNTLEKLSVDHIMFTPNRNLVNRIARRSLEKIGDACWTCHAGVNSFVWQIAVKYKIPLMVWGESVSESSGRDSYSDKKFKYDYEYMIKHSSLVKPKDMVCEYLKEEELSIFNLPTKEEIEKVKVFGIHLGDFIFWDEERQVEFIRKEYDWKEDDMEGTYKGYKSAECMMAGVHDFSCYLKRGFGRGSFHASMDVRGGLLSRDEGFELAKKHDPERPDALDYYLKITGLSEEEFYEILKKQRKALLKRKNVPVRPKNENNRQTRIPFIEKFINNKEEVIF